VVSTAVTIMPSSGMLRRVALVRTDVSVELSASIIRVTKLGELETLAVSSNRRTLRFCSVRRLQVTANVPSSLMMEALSSSETSVKRATRNIPEDAILHISILFAFYSHSIKGQLTCTHAHTLHLMSYIFVTLIK
jgi:hypothetical protein